MTKSGQAIVTSLMLIALLAGCKTNQQQAVKPPPVAHQQKPAWIAQLSKQGVEVKSHRTHLEVKLPFEQHFKQPADTKQYLTETLKPIAKQLDNNHYQLAEVIQYVDKNTLSKEDQAELEQNIADLTYALNQLNVETKVVVKSLPKRRRKQAQYNQPHGPYLAINLYQRHEGHGLVY